jgi:hypothetical protein
MNWLGLLNFFIFQWFFIRIAKICQVVIEGKEEKQVISGYKIIKWILPLSGWWNDYIYLKKKL